MRNSAADFVVAYPIAHCAYSAYPLSFVLALMGHFPMTGYIPVSRYIGNWTRSLLRFVTFRYLGAEIMLRSIHVTPGLRYTPAR